MHGVVFCGVPLSGAVTWTWSLPRLACRLTGASRFPFFSLGASVTDVDNLGPGTFGGRWADVIRA